MYTISRKGVEFEGISHLIYLFLIDGIIEGYVTRNKKVDLIKKSSMISQLKKQRIEEIKEIEELHELPD